MGGCESGQTIVWEYVASMGIKSPSSYSVFYVLCLRCLSCVVCFAVLCLRGVYCCVFDVLCFSGVCFVVLHLKGGRGV